jgi:hypothetical protein
LVIRKGLIKNNYNTVKLGCAVGILSLTLHGLVDFNFHILANMLLFVIYMAFIFLDPDPGEKA